MQTVKRVLRPERLRRVPAQFSWVDQALVQRRLIDRCGAPAAALYLFFVTVADARGLSYWGDAALSQRLGLGADELQAARARLIELDLIAHAAPLVQVLALPDSPTPPPPAPRPPGAGPMSLAELLGALERRRDRL